MLVSDTSPNRATLGQRQISDHLRTAADTFGHLPALGEAGRAVSLSFIELYRTSQAIAGTLRGWNLSPWDRVATFLPPGPAAASVLCGVMSAAVYAPLNPRGTHAEAIAAMKALGVRAIIVQRGIASAGRSAAMELGLAVIEAASPADAMPGAIELSCERPPSATAHDGDFEPIACVLQTSGTTSGPKIVPITDAALFGSIQHNVALLQLTPADRTLHVIAPVHVMGITTVLYSIMAGAQTICCPGLVAGEFFGWVRRHQPTWLTVPPALHHSILTAAGGHEDFLARHPLRFTRSGAAPMPAELAQRIERTWHAPLIEAYAMSECTLITSNGLGSNERRAGTVGRACCGTELMIVDDAGIPLPPGMPGEILIRGPHVLRAYENAPQANHDSFTFGWFRTGDLGQLDGDGFLTIAGRKKEQINRGGVKISPLEIDRVIEKHPAVAAALTFAIPDARLGETVGVAVVARAGHTPTEAGVREFAAGELGPEKVPQRVIFVPELPAGLGGKLLRIGLAAKLGLDREPPTRDPFSAPATPAEAALAAVWADVLRAQSPISATAHFADDLGGDSLQAVDMLEQATRLLGKSVSVSRLIAAPTIRDLAAVFDDAAASKPAYLIPIRADRRATHGIAPLFLLPGMHGHAFTFYPLVRALGGDRPIYGFTLPGVFDDPANLPPTLEALATMLLTELRAAQPHGPYLLGGYSFGGYLAFEIARQLMQAGETVERIIMFDVRGPGYPARGSFSHRMRYHARRVMAGSWRQRIDYVRSRTKRSKQPAPIAPGPSNAPGVATYDEVARRSVAMMRHYTPPTLDVRIEMIRAAKQPAGHAVCKPDPTMGWGRFSKRVNVTTSPGTHFTILDARNVAALVTVLHV